MEEFDLGSMFLLGLLGTGHCVGMCGPLVLAIPASSGRVVPHLLYHLGRVCTYVAVGAVVAALGAGLLGAAGGEADLARVVRIQVALSLIAAVLLLALALARLGVIREPAWMSLASPRHLPGFGRVAASLFERGGPWPTLGFGLMMGLLPCGLSYAAFARVVPAGSAVDGALLVLAFGAGTVPGLLVLGTAGSALARRWRSLSDLLAGLLLVAMALDMGLDAVLSLVG